MDRTTPAAPRTILLIEDDFNVRHGVATYLGERNLQVTPVETLACAHELLNRQRFDAVILDLNLGSEDGLVLAREIGLRGTPPLVIISARATETDRIIGLEIGADDYLAKPFGFGELHARLRAVWRRCRDAAISGRMRARFSGRTVDLGCHTLRSASGKVVRLTAGETALLRALLENPGVALSRAALLQLTDHSDVEVFDRVIDVVIARLRRKLDMDDGEPPLIDTIRGSGYRFNAAVSWEQTTREEELF